MDLTVQIITQNNQQEIIRTLQSLKKINTKIIVNDINSTDQTVAIAKKMNAQVVHFDIENRSELRKKISEQTDTQWQMYLNPGEVLLKGFNAFKELQTSYVSVLTQETLKKEIRIWEKEKGNFKNPIFEFFEYSTNHEIPVVIHSPVVRYTQEDVLRLDRWQEVEPTNAAIHYYKAIVYLALGCIDKFINESEHYMFMDNNKNSMASIMNRYYYALVQLHQKKVQNTLKNINLCLCEQPLMAEFWCLIGDVYYYLIKDFRKAIDFYENAIILGSRRQKNDKWPMDISKYKKHPLKMIDSCKKINESFSVFKTVNQNDE